VRVPVPDVIEPVADLGHVHFVGIGGAALSGIARIMQARGLVVSGSDAKDSAMLETLRALGIRCDVGHVADQIDGADTVVVSTAIRKDNPEVVAAFERGLRVWPRSAALQSVLTDRTTVAISGTHGKTSTTAMLTTALVGVGADPSYAIGSTLNATGLNAHDGAGSIFVAEADESDGAFLVYTTHGVVVTNVEADHLDHWLTPEAYAEAFERFVERVEPDGFAVCCIDRRACRGRRPPGRRRAVHRQRVGLHRHRPGAAARRGRAPGAG
jgi:UDP-N-acetylmuramate--alanine ligase